MFIPWSAFNATYRGRPKKDAKKIDLKKIKRMSIMMRRYGNIRYYLLGRESLSAHESRYSFFGTQEGDFSLSMREICALPEVPKADGAGREVIDLGVLEKGMVETNNIDNSNTASPQPYHSGPERELTYVSVEQIPGGFKLLTDVLVPDSRAREDCLPRGRGNGLAHAILHVWRPTACPVPLIWSDEQVGIVPTIAGLVRERERNQQP